MALRLVERSRDMSIQDANQLHLRRTAWLDFSGAGFTVVDHIAGQVRQGWRLEMRPPFTLESVRTASDVPLLVTSGMAPSATGVEVRQPEVNLTAVSRLLRAGGTPPATGWRERFASASGELIVEPGYRLLAALGPDAAPQAWLERWRLLDIFALLLTATAAGRLFGIRVAAIAVAAIVLSYQDFGVPLLVVAERVGGTRTRAGSSARATATFGRSLSCDCSVPATSRPRRPSHCRKLCS